MTPSTFKTWGTHKRDTTMSNIKAAYRILPFQATLQIPFSLSLRSDPVAMLLLLLLLTRAWREHYHCWSEDDAACRLGGAGNRWRRTPGYYWRQTNNSSFMSTRRTDRHVIRKWFSDQRRARDCFQFCPLKHILESTNLPLRSHPVAVCRCRYAYETKKIRPSFETI